MLFLKKQEVSPFNTKKADVAESAEFLVCLSEDSYGYDVFMVIQEEKKHIGVVLVVPQYNILKVFLMNTGRTVIELPRSKFVDDITKIRQSLESLYKLFMLD